MNKIDISRTSIDIPKELMKQVKMACIKDEVSIKEFILDAIKEKLKIK